MMLPNLRSFVAKVSSGRRPFSTSICDSINESLARGTDNRTGLAISWGVSGYAFWLAKGIYNVTANTVSIHQLKKALVTKGEEEEASYNVIASTHDKIKTTRQSKQTEELKNFKKASKAFGTNSRNSERGGLDPHKHDVGGPRSFDHIERDMEIELGRPALKEQLAAAHRKIEEHDAENLRRDKEDKRRDAKLARQERENRASKHKVTLLETYLMGRDPGLAQWLESQASQLPVESSTSPPDQDTDDVTSDECSGDSGDISQSDECKELEDLKKSWKDLKKAFS